MKNRSIFAFSFFCILLCMSLDVRSYAQQAQFAGQYLQKVKLEQKWNDSILFLTQEKDAIASLRAFGNPFNHTEIGFHYEQEKLTPIAFATIPQKVSAYSIYASGLKQLGRFTFSGKASYRKQGEYEISQLMSAKDELFYPFVLASNVSSLFRSELYSIRSAGAYRLTKRWSVGASLSYDGVIRYTRQDPRVLSISSDNRYALSFSFSPARLGLFSASLGYQHYFQNISYSILQPNTSQWIYIMRPLGEYNFRYSGLEGNGSTYRHVYRKYKSSFQWLNRQFNSCVGLDMNRAEAELQTREAGVSINNLISNTIAPYFMVDLYHLGDRATLTGAFESTFVKKKGVERVYEFVKVDNQTSLIKSKLLAENESYSERSSLYNFTLGCRYAASRYTLHAKAIYRQEYFDGKHLMEPLYSRLKKSCFGTSLKLFWKESSNNRFWTETLAEAMWCLRRDLQQNLNRELKTYLLEEGRLQYHLGPQVFYSLSQELNMRLRPSSIQHFKILLQLRGEKWSQESKTLLSTSMGLAYVF